MHGLGGGTGYVHSASSKGEFDLQIGTPKPKKKKKNGKKRLVLEIEFTRFTTSQATQRHTQIHSVTFLFFFLLNPTKYRTKTKATQK
jgi:hypothetical protein